MKANGWKRAVKPPIDIRALENVVKAAKAKWASARKVYDAAWLEYNEAAKRLKAATDA